MTESANRAKRRHTESVLSEIPHPKRMCDIPSEHRGPSNNKYGGHTTSRLRGYWTKGVKRFSPCTVFNEDEKAAVAEELRKKGEID